MSDLRPDGISVTIGEEAHSLLFTLNVIDAVQSKYGEIVSKVLKRLFDDMLAPSVIRFVLTELLNDECLRKGGRKLYSEETIGTMVTLREIPEITKAIIESYGISIPVDEEDGETENGELLDVAQLLMIAATKMGYSEEEIFKMTPRKFFLLFDRFLELNGKGKKEAGIDDLP